MKELLDTHNYRTLGKDRSILVVWRVAHSKCSIQSSGEKSTITSLVNVQVLESL